MLLAATDIRRTYNTTRHQKRSIPSEYAHCCIYTYTYAETLPLSEAEGDREGEVRARRREVDTSRADRMRELPFEHQKFSICDCPQQLLNHTISAMESWRESVPKVSGLLWSLSPYGRSLRGWEAFRERDECLSATLRAFVHLCEPAAYYRE